MTWMTCRGVPSVRVAYIYVCVYAYIFTLPIKYFLLLYLQLPTPSRLDLSIRLCFRTAAGQLHPDVIAAERIVSPVRTSSSASDHRHPIPDTDDGPGAAARSVVLGCPGTVPVRRVSRSSALSFVFQEIAGILINFESHNEWLSKEVKIRWVLS